MTKPKNKSELILGWTLGLIVTGIWIFGVPTYFWGLRWWTPIKVGIAIAIDIAYTYFNSWFAINYDRLKQR